MIKGYKITRLISLLLLALVMITAFTQASASPTTDTDGRVTDSDGFLGDTDSPEELTSSRDTERVTSPESTAKKETVGSPGETETLPTADANGIGMLGVIIAFTVIAAVLIIVIVIIPKKRS